MPFAGDCTARTAQVLVLIRPMTPTNEYEGWTESCVYSATNFPESGTNPGVNYAPGEQSANAYDAISVYGKTPPLPVPSAPAPAPTPAPAPIPVEKTGVAAVFLLGILLLLFLIGLLTSLNARRLEDPHKFRRGAVRKRPAKQMVKTAYAPWKILHLKSQTHKL